MLDVVDRIAVTHLACREKVGIAASRQRPRLDARSQAHAEAPSSDGPPGHGHDPVDATRLMAAVMFTAGLVKKLDERGAMHHQTPAFALPMDGVHWSQVGLPRGARGIA